MSNQKKQIILNEIAFWKKSKMLPEKYCDYLTMIYTEGRDDETSLRGNAKESVKGKERSQLAKRLTIVIGAAVVLVAALFLIPIVAVAVGLVALAAVGFMAASSLFAKSKTGLAIALQVGAAILLLALTVRVTAHYFAGNNKALYAGLAINCVFWFVSGWKLRLPYFTFSGILGVVALVGYWLYQLS